MVSAPSADFVAYCAGCGETQHEPAFEGRDWLKGCVPGIFGYGRCTSCGTVNQRRIPSEEVLASAYSRHHETPLEEPTRLQALAERIATGEARWLVRKADASGSLVDIGCGSGGFLRRLQRSGWSGRLSGVEFVKETADTAGVRLGLEIRQGDAESVTLARGAYGTIVLRHVIEHLRDPGAVLDRLHSAIETRGSLMLATPDSRALSAKVTGRFWPGWDPPRHLHVFTSRTLRSLARLHGFEPVAERWSFSPDFWTGGLRHALIERGAGARLRRLSEGPAGLAPASFAALLEVALRRSAMYTVIMRRV